jgi:hypothetical protein
MYTKEIILCMIVVIIIAICIYLATRGKKSKDPFEFIKPPQQPVQLDIFLEEDDDDFGPQMTEDGEYDVNDIMSMPTAIQNGELNAVISLVNRGAQVTMWNLEDAITNREYEILSYLLSNTPVRAHPRLVEIAISTNVPQQLIRLLQSRI